ncbi:MAG: hypothetical protein ABIN37_02140 [Burkholderiaceae bacterium]
MQSQGQTGGCVGYDWTVHLFWSVALIPFCRLTMETSNTALFIAAIVLVCLVGGFLFYRSRQKGNPDIDSAFLESRQAPEYVQTQIYSQASQSIAPRRDVDPVLELIGDINADPIVGASILMQSGKKKEAEQVLIRASLASPERNDTLLALLDLYISSRDEKGVTGVMCLLKTKTSTKSPERERATRAFNKSGIKWSAEMQEKFDNLVEQASSEI